MHLTIIYLHKEHFNQINIKNKVNYNYHNSLIKAKKLETKKKLIVEKIYKSLTIYIARYDHKKSTEMLRLFIMN